jgi:hypothetical protein
VFKGPLLVLLLGSALIVAGHLVPIDRVWHAVTLLSTPVLTESEPPRVAEHGQTSQADVTGQRAADEPERQQREDEAAAKQADEAAARAEAAQRAAEEQARRREAEAEAEAKRAAEEAARQREAEAAARRALEEQERQREAEAAAKRAVEEAARAEAAHAAAAEAEKERAAEEAARTESARRAAEAEAAERRAAEQAARDEAARRAAAEAERRRQAEAAARKAELEAEREREAAAAARARLRILVTADVHDRAGLGRYSAADYARLAQREVIAIARSVLGDDAVADAADAIGFRDRLRTGRAGLEAICADVDSARVLMVDSSIQAAGFSTVDSAYWPEVVFTAVNCDDLRAVSSEKNRLEPHRLDRFEFQHQLAAAARNFVSRHAWFLGP